MKRALIIIFAIGFAACTSGCAATFEGYGIKARVDFLKTREEQLRALSAITGDPQYAAQADADRCELSALEAEAPNADGN
jgi:hypothetical protein